MKIVSWNCNGAFREKFEEIMKEDADIYVIQECENPQDEHYKSYKKYLDFAGDNYYWKGDIHYKGLGVFVKNPDIKTELITDFKDNFKNFLLMRINDSFNLLCVWVVPPKNNYYVELIHDLYDAHPDIFDENLVMCGDFNSSSVFNNHHSKTKNHDVLEEKLEKSGLVSAYHYLNNEENGKENQKTFYQARHLNDNYHLDYVYSKAGLIKELRIEDHYKWINMSDHLPIKFEI